MALTEEELNSYNFHATVDMPDEGEDGVFVRLNLPTGESIVAMYKAHYGSVDVILPKKCEAVCLAGSQIYGLHIADVGGQRAVVEADQIMISVGPTREK